MYSQHNTACACSALRLRYLQQSAKPQSHKLAALFQGTSNDPGRVQVRNGKTWWWATGV